MKIALSSSGSDLKSALDPRFGRCAYFLIVNPEDMSFEVFDNESANQSSGAGIQAARFVADKGAEAVITGRVGPKAAEALSAAGIDVFTQQQGTIESVLERFKNGNLKLERGFETNSPQNMDSSARPAGRGMCGGGRNRST